MLSALIENDIKSLENWALLSLRLVEPAEGGRTEKLKVQKSRDGHLKRFSRYLDIQNTITQARV